VSRGRGCGNDVGEVVWVAEPLTGRESHAVLTFTWASGPPTCLSTVHGSCGTQRLDSQESRSRCAVQVFPHFCFHFITVSKLQRATLEGRGISVVCLNHHFYQCREKKIEKCIAEWLRSGQAVSLQAPLSGVYQPVEGRGVKYT
jgi:hypothetical protein